MCINRWPNTSCQVTARYYKPGTDDKETKIIQKFETQTLSSMRMKLTDDNTSCTLQTSSILMRAQGPDSSCEINSLDDGDSSNSSSLSSSNPRNKEVNFKINYSITPATPNKPSPFTLDIDFKSLSPPFQFNDGKVHFGSTRSGSDGFIQMKFIPSGRCIGKIQIDGKEIDFKGVGICLRQFQGIKPHVATKRWNCAYFCENCDNKDQPIRTLFTIQMQSSLAYNGEIIYYGFYFDGTKLNAVTSAGNEIIYSKTKTDRDTGYCVPEHFDYRWKGVGLDGTPFEATVSGTPTSRMARIDLLENLPIVLRKIVESFTSARPYIYQNYNQDVEAVINGEKVQGTLFQEFSFLLEDPSYCEKIITN